MVMLREEGYSQKVEGADMTVGPHFGARRCVKDVTPLLEPLCRGQLTCDGTRTETRFRLLAKRTSPFKSAGASVSVDYCAAEVCASAVVMLDTPCSEVV